MQKQLVLLLVFLIGSLAQGLPSCPPLPSRARPTNVRDLRADDIRLVMSIGESMSAGFGLKNLPNEYRGLAFSAGGDPGAMTMPNLLRSAGNNALLLGDSRGVHYGIHTSDDGCEPPSDTQVCRLNAAVDGANMARSLRQVDYLDAQIHSNSSNYTKYADDWKLLTLFSGLSDCVFYNETDSTHSPTPVEVVRSNFRALMSQVRKRIGHVFVNVIALPTQISKAGEVIKNRGECKLFIELSKAGQTKWTDYSLWDGAAKAINKMLAEEVKAIQNLNDPTFYASLQTFMVGFDPATETLEKLDCIHPNQESEAAMSVALWNSMIAPGAKPTALDHSEQPVCPTEHARLH